jgi:replicative DNA helicase
MTAETANYRAAADLFPRWRDSILTGEKPIFYPCGDGPIAGLELGPGRVVLIGGPPGSGKTGLVGQLVFEAVARTADLKALICNVEMSPESLLDRQLARLSGIDLTTIHKRELGGDHGEQLAAGLDRLEDLAERVAFLAPPFSLGNVALAYDDFEAHLIVLDYVQRFKAKSNHDSERSTVGELMNFLRQFADARCAVLAVSSVSRARDAKGRSTYSGDELNLASYRESSELEFGADDAYMLTRQAEEAGPSIVTLRHLKSRNGEMRDIPLRFHGATQTFTPLEADEVPPPKSGSKRRRARGEKPAANGDRFREDLLAAWDATEPAGDDE